MLEVQKFLQTKSFDDLTAELGIKVNRHETLPLVILNYDQIESPKTHPIVRECRALVLNADTHAVVARSFPRFFNWGEVQDEMGQFDFGSVSVQSKEDGSLCLLYFFSGQWRVNTRGSFAQDNMQFHSHTWEQAVCKALGVKTLDDVGAHLSKDITYVCEFCSPWNKIVRRYDEPCLYLLTAFFAESGDELTHEQCDGYARASGMLRPELYNFCTIDEIQSFLQTQSETDPTYEGVVMKDRNGKRWKVKSPTYLGLHKMRGEGDNLFNPKNLLPFIMAGEDSELLTYFPEVREAYYELKAKVLGWYADTLEKWVDNKDIEDQKDFALAVKSHKFSAVLFSVRKKYGKEQNSKNFKQEWREADKLILKHIV